MENCPGAGGATYMPGVYKIPMVRMWLTTTDKIRMYGSRRRNGRNAIAVITAYVG